MPVPIRLLCTVRTPSALEATVIAALADIGWQVAVRADFDVAGLAHVRMLLAACSRARPWRMGALDYTRSGSVAQSTPVEAPARFRQRGQYLGRLAMEPEGAG
ncbi:DUF2399 domain-containing protein [Amycolatopsis sp. NPDC051373]|uniref:DUF2399 domain-containing protein n=1 Tax=Amycolatopsis sp. NPDC051373 TaxID=3155801 RepID=UPI00345042CE